MSMEAPMDMSTVLEPEIEALSLSAESFWDVAVPFQSAEASTEKNINHNTRSGSNVISGSKSSVVNITVAVLVLVLAVIIGFLLVSMMGSWFINLRLNFDIQILLANAIREDYSFFIDYENGFSASYRWILLFYLMPYWTC